MVAPLHTSASGNVPDSIFAEALQVVEALDRAEVKSGTQVATIQSSTNARNMAITSIISMAYYTAIGDNGGRGVMLHEEDTSNTTRLVLPIPAGMEKLPVRAMQEKVKSLQRELLGELQQAKAYVMFPDTQEYYRLEFPNAPGTQDDKLDHTVARHMLVSLISKAHGVTVDSVQNHLLAQIYWPKSTCMIYPEERAAILAHEIPRTPDLPTR